VLCLVGLVGCGSAPEPRSAGPGSAESTPSESPPASAKADPTASASKSTAAGPVVTERLRFTATTVDGEQFDAASLAGKPIGLWFWAPWCPLCRAEAPTAKQLSRTYAGKVNIVGVSGLDNLDAMRGFVSDTGVDGIPHLADENGEVWKRFGITTQSTWVFLDADGKVVA
jgi:thiol-disulfide isomerase/thioredoxin